MDTPNLRTVKEHNADPNISLNLKFRNNDLSLKKTGYVLANTDGTYQYFANVDLASKAFSEAVHVKVLDELKQTDKFKEAKAKWEALGLPALKLFE